MPRRVPPRIFVPVAAAVLCAAAAFGVVWWQLRETKLLIDAGTGDNGGSGQVIATALQPATEDSGDEALLHLRRGDLAALRGEWAEAAEEFAQSAEAGGGLSALRKLAQAQLQRRDIDGARDTLDRLKRAGARAEDVLLLESVILLRTGNVAEARTQLDAAPDSPQKHYGLLLLAVIEARHDAAKAELAAVATGWEPVLRAHAKTLQGAYDEFALFPDSPAIHLTTLLARALAQVQECELALPLLTEVNRQQDDYRDAWILRGFCELTTERTQDALASLERAYAIDPEKPQVQFLLARAYGRQNDHRNALTFAQYALENGYEPKAEARRLVAREAIALGDATAALEQYALLTDDPDAAIDAYGEYVSVALSAGRVEDAYSKAQQATQRWPEDARAFDILGWAAMESGRKDEARAALDKALTLNPELRTAQERREEL